jgi:PilX N-terminal
MHNLRIASIQSRPQRGAAALTVSIVLLIVMALIGFFVNRGMIFEQRTSANQYRATKAFEMAEAGLEWAVAQLNAEAPLTAAPGCTVTTGAAANTFAARYLTIGPGGLGVVANGRASGSIAANGSVTASCPLPGNAATLGGADEPRFMVEFSKVGVTDPWAVRIIARGCTNAGNYCVDGSTAAPAPDGVAVVSAGSIL